MSRSLKLWGGEAHADGSNKNDDIGGIISGSNLQDKNGTVIGALKGDQIDGKFTDKNGIIITVAGKRTL